MRYRSLGNSGTAVSELCLGTMTFGNETDEAGAHEQLDRYVEAGGNLVDTADVYTHGVSEEIIGRWLADRPSDITDRVVLATKGRFPFEAGPNNGGSSARHLTRAIDASLERLGLDSVDLYQVHAWDPRTPLEETLRTLDGFVRSGRTRYYGFSNYTGWQLTKAVGAGPRAGSGGAGDAPAAVQPDRPRDRVGGRPRGAGRRPRPAAVEPARRRLADRQVPARPATHRRHPPRRRPGSWHGGLRPARHRADVGHHRSGPADRRGARHLDGDGRAGLGHRPARASPRRSSVRAPSSSSRTTCPRSRCASTTTSARPSTRRATCTPPTTRTARWASTSATATWRPASSSLPWASWATSSQASQVSMRDA